MLLFSLTYHMESDSVSQQIFYNDLRFSYSDAHKFYNSKKKTRKKGKK